MTYSDINEMFGSSSLRDRITSAIAKEVPGMIDPVSVANQYMWPLIAREDWIAAWASAPKDCTECGQPRDTGLREDVITDQMILSAIQDVAQQQAQQAQG